jgi:hypothetical protein
MTADLAAHLVLREHFRRWTAERIEQEKADGYQRLVDQVRTGAPLIPWRLPGLRTLVNGTEFVIHHEDVRRANGYLRRTGDPVLDQFAWRMSGLLARRLVRRIRPHGVAIEANGRERRFGRADVVVRADPVDLALYLSGRRSGVDVSVEGTSAALEAIARADVHL